MKTKEELNALKEEVETLTRKLAELTEEELKAVAGGGFSPCSNCPHSRHCDSTPEECWRYR